MVLSGIKNFFINLKHFFTPIGALALGVVIGLGMLVPGVFAAVSGFIESVKEVTGNVTLDFESLADSLLAAIGGLDWNDPSAAIDTITNSDWLQKTLSDCVHALIPGADAYAAQITEAAASAAAQIIVWLLMLALWTAIGLAAGFMLTRFLVRRTIARRSWWKNLISGIVDLVLISAITAFILWIQGLWAPGAAIAGVFGAILYGAEAMFKGYIIFGRKKLKFKEVVNAKNAGLILLTDLIVLLIVFAFIIAAYVLAGTIAGTFITISLAEIGTLVIACNAEAYVKTMAEKAEESLQAAQT